MKHIKLAIKPHTLKSNELCAICGTATEPQKPFDLFMDATSQLVCKECAGKYAPELVSLMDYFYKGHYVEPEYETVENEIQEIKSLAAELQAEDFDQLDQVLYKISKKAYTLRKFVINNLILSDKD
ncbi:MAG: hypothetical protein GY868_17005 [Deltaproteobacteria bacterium]|nr:hypothetical protein [Deltaproteobacteria bacterium]